jgi:hypothetical protein
VAPSEIRTNAQRLDDAVELQHLQMQRAASTVRQRVTDPEACSELLECLGLQEV